VRKEGAVVQGSRECVIYEESLPGWYVLCGYGVSAVALAALAAFCVIVYRSAGPVGAGIVIVFASLTQLLGGNVGPTQVVAGLTALTIKLAWLPVRVRIAWRDVASAWVCNPWRLECAHQVWPVGPLRWHAGMRAWLLDDAFRWVLTARGPWHHRLAGVLFHTFSADRTGVLLEMRSGRRIWIGSGRPEELFRAAEIGTGRSFT
jgi:hypothetical protein